MLVVGQCGAHRVSLSATPESGSKTSAAPGAVLVSVL
jgi:hypothetical protein